MAGPEKREEGRRVTHAAFEQCEHTMTIILKTALTLTLALTTMWKCKTMLEYISLLLRVMGKVFG
jgi:hypothetical protein